MLEKALLRKRYGNAFITILPDGRRIPWKPLSVGDYLEYEGRLNSGQYPVVVIEDEIFRKCVLDPVLINQIDKLHAGVVSTVVQTIMQASGPSTLQELQGYFNLARIRANAVLHDMANMICQAYPAYTPEDVYAMDLETFLVRGASAERKLLNSGILKEPISFVENEDKKDMRKRPQPIVQQEVPKPPPVNLAKAHKAQKQTNKQTVITKTDILEHEAMAYTGHEKADKIVLEHQMIKDTLGIYKDYVKDLNEGKGFTPKTVEERKAAALAQARKNEAAYNAAMAKKSSAEKAELARLAEERKKKKAAKRNRR